MIDKIKPTLIGFQNNLSKTNKKIIVYKDQYNIDLKNYNYYLEIGCFKDDVFSNIIINNKVGVDPISGGNVRSTSDVFFKNNKKNFDIIFIDGLHHYKQVKKDIENSLLFLNEHGIVVLHDTLPRNYIEQATPQ